MKTAQKIALSLLISVLVFGVFSVFAFSGLFDYIETTFFDPRVRQRFEDRLSSAESVVRQYHEATIENTAGVVENPAVRRLARTNQSREDIVARQNLIGLLSSESASFSSVRIFVDGGERLVYSSDEGDIREQNAFRREYVPVSDLSEEVRALVPEEPPQTPEIELVSEQNLIVYRMAFLDEFDTPQGTALFFFGTLGVENRLTRAGLLVPSDRAVVVRDNAVALNASLGQADSLRSAVNEGWEEIASPEWSFPTVLLEGDAPFVVFSTRSTEGIRYLWLAPESEFHMTTGMRIILLASVVLSTFLLVFLLLNVRQDPVLVVSERIKRFQINLLRSYFEAGEKVSWEAWQQELANRRDELTADIKRGIGRLSKDREPEVDELISRSWDEIIGVIGSRARLESPPTDIARLESIVQQVVNNLQSLPQTGRTVEAVRPSAPTTPTTPPPPAESERLEETALEALEPEELEPEELEAEEIEEFAEVPEPEALEEVEPEALEAQELVEVDESEEADSEELDEIGALEEEGEEIEAEEIEEFAEVPEPEALKEVEPETLEAPELLEVDESEEADSEELDEIEALEEAGEEVEEIEEIEEVAEVPESEALKEVGEPADELEPLESIEALSEIDAFDREFAGIQEEWEVGGPEDVEDSFASVGDHKGVLERIEGIEDLGTLSEEPSTMAAGSDEEEASLLEPLEEAVAEEVPESLEALESVGELEPEEDEFEELVEDEESVGEGELIPTNHGGSSLFASDLFGFSPPGPIVDDTIGDEEVEELSAADFEADEEVEEIEEVPEVPIAEAQEIEELPSRASKRQPEPPASGTIRLESLDLESSPDVDVVSLRELVSSRKEPGEVIRDENGFFQIDSAAYYQAYDAASGEMKRLVESVTRGVEDEGGGSGIDELVSSRVGLDLFPISDASEDREESSDPSRGDDSYESRVLLTESGIDYDRFLSGYKRTESGVFKSLVTFTRIAKARAASIFVKKETACVPAYTLGIDDACSEAIRIPVDSFLYRQVLGKQKAILFKHPLQHFADFSGVCSDSLFSYIGRVVICPIRFRGEEAYLFLSAREGIDSVQAFFDSIGLQVKQASPT